MSSIFFWWLGLAIFDAGMLIFYVHWYLKHPDPNDFTGVTLWNFICVVGACLCPVVNILVTIGLVIWFIDEPASKIILFGGPKK